MSINTQAAMRYPKYK